MNFKDYLDYILCHPGNYEIHKKNEEYLLIDFEYGNWLRTNQTGRDIIELFDGKLTTKEVFASYAQKNNLPYELVEKMMSKFVLQAMGSRFLVPVEYSHPRKDDGLLRDPAKIWVHVTNICNLQCPFCYSNSGRAEKAMYFDQNIFFEKIVDKLNNPKNTGVVISGGEPMLWEGLYDFVVQLYKKEIHVTLITNGTLPDEDKYQQILPMIDVFQISIDGTCAEIHEKTRGKGNFGKVLKSFELGKKYAKTVCAAFTLNKYNIEDLPNLPEYAFKLGASNIHINRLIPVGRGSQCDLINPETEKQNEYIRKFYESVQKIQNEIHKIREVFEFNLPEHEKTPYLRITVSGDQSKKLMRFGKRKSCGVGTGILSIKPDMTVFPCPSFHEDQFILGDLKGEEFDEIKKKGYNFNKKINIENEKSECFNCKEKYFCGGGCRAIANSFGNIMGQDPSCNYYREEIRRLLWKIPAKS